MFANSLLTASVLALATAAPVEKGTAISGFWYAPFASGGSGGSTCAPATPLAAPSSGSLASFFWGKTVDQWCTKTYIETYLQGSAKYPGSPGTTDSNWADISDSFPTGASHTYKLFTIGGGTGKKWSKDMIEKLESNCYNSKGLLDYIFENGYNGVIIDYEYQKDSAAKTALQDFVDDFKTNHAGKYLMFTTVGNSDADGVATDDLVSVLSTRSTKYDYVVPQLYDENACVYDTDTLSTAKTAFSGITSDKILLGVPQGVSVTNSGISNSGSIEWLYRPVAA